MNFMEAIRAMKEGKKIEVKRGGNNVYHLEGDYIENENRGKFVVSNYHSLLGEWEIVEEKKTLWDKKSNASMEDGWQLQDEDVKEHLKYFLERIEHRTTENTDIIQIAEEIFGKYLIE